MITMEMAFLTRCKGKEMENHSLVNQNVIPTSAAAINNILANYEDEIRGGDANYASTKSLETVKAQTITFYFGDKVIGEVKFHKSGTKAEKIMRSKMQLIKEMQKKDNKSLIGNMLFSPFCNFKIN